ncbi:MAG: type II CAAX endopeptidase family protein [Ginsengibacter sp.]
MNHRNSINFSFPRQMGILLMLIGGGIIMGALVSALVWLGMTGQSPSNMQTDMADPKNYYAIITLQAVTTFFIFFLPSWIFARIYYRKPGEFTGFHTRFNVKQLIWMVVILALTFPLSGTLSELTRTMPLPEAWKVKFDAMEAAREAQEAILIKINSLNKYFISLILIGILPAIFEEILFRGVLQNVLTKWFKGPWVAIILTAFVFSIIHASFYGFFVRFALGIILGLVFYYSRSLWLVIIFHFLYNGLQVTALYLLNLKGTVNLKDLDGSFPFWAGALATGLLIYALKRFKDISWKEQEVFKYTEPDDPENFHDWIAKNS